MHHPKKWGANQHNWKAHDIESLSHLIEEALRYGFEQQQQHPANKRRRHTQDELHILDLPEDTLRTVVGHSVAPLAEVV